MLNISEINNFPQQEQVFAALREIAQKYCPEDLQQERKNVFPLPDEQLDLSVLSGVNAEPFGIGIPESQKLRNLNYEEVDTLNTEEIKKDFPVLNQKVNGHDLVWLDNGATTQKPLQVIDKISDYYKNYN